MGSIFISYRRAETSEVVGRIYDRLVGHFPPASIFRDLDSIPLGTPFPDVLRHAIEVTSLGLVIIGPQWSLVTNEGGVRRLQDPNDFVRLEVEALLARDIPIIPCLVSNASMPLADTLPDSIRPLLLRHGLPVRADPDFHRDMDRLIEHILGAVPDLERRDQPDCHPEHPRVVGQGTWKHPSYVLAGMMSIGASIWVGWEVGFDRDPIVSSLFLFAVPALILSVPILPRLREIITTRRRDEKNLP